MRTSREPGDPRRDVARYTVDRLRAEAAATDPEGVARAEAEEVHDAGRATMDERAQYVEIAVQQAIRRGDFDDLPGAGKPLTGLTGTHDPDWWIRRKIEREQLTGLGPPALTLRSEDARLDDLIDAAPSESRIREILDDFNRRIIEARRQLQGGPPVITPLRDVEHEIEQWRARRDDRVRRAVEAREAEEARLASMTWRERRRERRLGRDGRP